MLASQKRRRTGRSLLPLSQSARLSIVTTGTGTGTIRKRLLDEVGEDDGGTVVGESFNKFNERDC
jgi:hypothetical protein